MILGLDTATSRLTVAVRGGGDTVAASALGPTGTGRPRHAQELLPAVEAAVGAAGGWDAIERIGVGVGPGTFTGLRIGIATARALAQARSLPITGVSSLAALAGGSSGDPVLAVIDAKRGEVFAAMFGADGERLWDDAVYGPDELADRLTDVPAPVAVGAGALMFRECLEAAGARVPPDADSAHDLNASFVCTLAAKLDSSPIDEIEPNYLRRPDAELWRERVSKS